MPWPIPSAKEIFSKTATRVESALLKLKRDVDPYRLSEAVRGAHGVISNLLRVIGMETRETHDHIAWQARQIMVDTAEDEFTIRHGSIWGIERRPATHATGTVLLEGLADTPLPAQLIFRSASGRTYTNSGPSLIGDDGTVLLTVAADDAGSAGNMEPDVLLEVVSDFPAIERATIAAPGLSGGAEEETPQQHTDAIIDHIRQRPHGGAGFDYPFWLGRQFDVRAVAVLPDWIGRGSVGIATIMRDGIFGRAPTPTEIDQQWDYLGRPGTATGVRPVTAHVVVLPGELRAIDLRIRIRPDTPSTRAAVTEAYSAFLATLGDESDDQNASPIGATLELSRLSEAISAASGEYAHDLLEPAANVQLEATQYPLPGNITFEAAQ